MIKMVSKCDHKIYLRLKEKIYKIVMRLVILYNLECWATKKQHTKKKLCFLCYRDKEC